MQKPMTAWPMSHGSTTTPNHAARTVNNARLNSQALSTSLRRLQCDEPIRESRARSIRHADRTPPVPDCRMNA
jgi:hypothetical protein